MGNPNRADGDRGRWAGGEAWAGRLLDLGQRLRTAVRQALAAGPTAELRAAVAAGAGDTTFGIDAVAERAVDAWLDEVRREGPLSLLTEDTGWRHVGPGGALPGFDHGGPRLTLDPIDGTRHLMYDLRSAWVVSSASAPGAGAPRVGDVVAGVVLELPCRGPGRGRELVALRGEGVRQRFAPLDGDPSTPPGAPEAPWATLPRLDDALQLDAGYFPFFGYEPRGRAGAQELAARVFEDLAGRHPLDAETVLDDQYISSGGQLVHVALGTYRTIVDPRATLARMRGDRARTAKPYDVAGAILLAREAGATVCALDGSALDFELDARTPVEFAAFANEATARAFLPAIERALREMAASG